MQKSFFMADPHFGHTNIIKYNNRPFANIEAMNKAIIDNINATVGENDFLYILGDFAFKNPAFYLSQIKCKLVHLVEGNHDPKECRSAGFVWVRSVATVRVNGEAIFLSHYPHRSWNRSHHGAIHLFGHEHGQLPDWGLSTDVGVDGWANFFPVTLEQIKERLKGQEPIKHH